MAGTKNTKFELNFNDIKKFADSAEYKKSLEFNERFQGFKSHDDMIKSFSNFKFKGAENSKNISINTFNDICGFAPNIPAFINCEPENMYNFETQHKNNIIELKIYICLPSNIRASEIEANGLILAQFLEKNATSNDKFKVSFNFKIKGVYKCFNDEGADLLHKEAHISLKVSDFSDYIPIETLAVICSPAMFRFYGIASVDYLQGFKKRVCNGSPIQYHELNDSDKKNYINFMDIKSELNKIKIY
jgi:hypothetical protein